MSKVTKLVGSQEFARLARAGATEGVGVMRASVSEPEVIDEQKRTIRFVFSDGSLDRAGDTIDPAGWELASFRKNPVALWAHDSSSPPIGRASNVGVVAGKLMGTVEFMKPEISAFADSIYRMVKGDFIRAVSVGFMPLEWRHADGKERNGIDFKRQELLEISVCPVPCNPNALQEGKSLDLRAIRQWARMLPGVQDVASRQAQRIRAETALLDAGYSPRHAEILAEAGIRGKCGREPEAPCGMHNAKECAAHRWGAQS